MSRETDLAWAAGIIDGEGCIHLRSHGGRRRPKQHIRDTLTVTITNTSLLMLARFQEIFGIGQIHRQRFMRARRRQTWQYVVYSSNAERVLRAIEPFLVNKKEEGRLGVLSRQYIRRGVTTPNPNAVELSWIAAQLSRLKRVDGAIENPPPSDALPLFDLGEG